MHNSQKPTVDDLPTSAQLLKSTVIAAGVAAAILVTVVLPSEYNIDPTGVGRVLGLSEMGEIKQQLAEEAEMDRQMEEVPVGPQTSIGSALLGLIVGTAYAQEAPAEGWTDTITVDLDPGQGTEVKLVMEEGAVVPFEWTVTGGVVNHDQHGDGSGDSISYEKGRAVEGQSGEMTAAFTGNHGWFWRNRGDEPVTVTLNVRGAYSKIKRFE
ncbi:transmembrane anchor protein [Paracoccus benzoatiresistens]|uniref:Transmembrane anchor protein n=1 Tax=Paracoccus benzoatiresistens TaxID=2997341 RepID=A0ABT4JAI8_9RHOB|nr:transmembrane anchor protein [Paracoccus sp. EF6]MCZ0964143.1 transmembrane anchor protein [Paracoccus sp. EF6]